MQSALKLGSPGDHDLLPSHRNQILGRRGSLRHFADGLISLSIITLLILVTHLIPPYQTKVADADPAYNYEYRDEQVPPSAVFVVGALSWMLVAISAVVIWRDPADCYRSLLVWALAIALTYLVTNALKISVGKPRPNYFNNPNKIDRGLSFPSGHSSISMAACHLLFLWFQYHLSDQSRFKFTTTLICALPHLLAGWIAITRIHDFYHDSVDVTVGALIGLAMSRLAFFRHYAIQRNRTASELPRVLVKTKQQVIANNISSNEE